MLGVFLEELQRERSPSGLNLMDSVRIPGIQPGAHQGGVKGIFSCSKWAGKPAGEQMSSPRCLNRHF